MKILIATMALLMGATIVKAQIAGPFITGDETFGGPVELRCMNNETFKSVLHARNMHIAAMGEQQEDIQKVLFVNPDGTILIANVINTGQVCVTDIIENAYLSSEWKVIKEEHEN